MTCLTAISALASRVSSPSHEDRRRLDRVFNYIYTTRHDVMRFKRGGDVSFEAFIDASFGTQPQGKSRTGVLIKMAGCAVGAWSTKQKIVTRSSTEAEVVAISDGLTNVIWLRRFLSHQGYTLPPTVIWEDNKSCIDLLTKPRHNAQRTRHLDIRYFYARELQELGMIDIKFAPTDDMEADLLTKGWVGPIFTKLAARMIGIT